MTTETRTEELGIHNAPVRPEKWIAHRNVAADWSAVTQKTVIEVVHQKCMEDPFRPLLIVVASYDAHVPLTLLMDVVYKSLDVIDWCGAVEPVPYVENMSGPPGSLLQDVIHLKLDLIPRCQQRHRVQVALDRPVKADFLPGV